jgi:hypothetical protein
MEDIDFVDNLSFSFCIGFPWKGLALGSFFEVDHFVPLWGAACTSAPEVRRFFVLDRDSVTEMPAFRFKFVKCASSSGSGGPCFFILLPTPILIAELGIFL